MWSTEMAARSLRDMTGKRVSLTGDVAAVDMIPAELVVVPTVDAA
jgi:hypothetical protein